MTVLSISMPAERTNARPASTRASSVAHRISRGRWGYAFVGPAVLLLLVVNVYPILRVLQLSFAHYDVQTGTSRWTGTENFKRVLTDETFYTSLGNTFLYTILVVPVALSLALALACLVAPLGPRSQAFFKAAFYLPGVVSSVVLALVWTWIYNPDFGLLNAALSMIGIDPVLWLGDRRVALFSIAVVSILSSLGVPLMLLLAALANIPDDYYEAARIDGAGALRQFWSITLPLIRPTMLYLLVVLTIGSFQVFETVYLMTNGGPSYGTTTLVFLIYESAFRFFDFGVASAQAIVMFLLIVVLAVVQFRGLGGDVD
jgi:multiple sugar transport system permease protein